MILRFIQRAWSGSFSAQAEYRGNYLFALLGSLVNVVLAVMTISVIYRSGGGFPGWTIDESLLVLGLFSVATGILGTFLWPNLSAIVDLVESGRLDFVLMKPIDSQLQVSLSVISPRSVIDIFVGGGMVVYACAGIGVSPVDVALALIPFCFGLLIIYSIWLAVATTSIWFVRINNASNVLNAILGAARYPVSAYPRGYQIALTYVMPITFLATVPAEVAIGRGKPTDLAVGAIAAISAFLLSRAFWKKALRSYSGASG